jgi:hypothetical protein
VPAISSSCHKALDTASEHRRSRRENVVHVHARRRKGIFRYGDEPQPDHPPPAWDLERFMTAEILRFNEEFGVVILPEEVPQLGQPSEGAAMSLARVQFFSISLDGFGTGEGQSLGAPFGHAGERLHDLRACGKRTSVG